MKEKKSIFWGWYVVMGAFLISSISYGARYSFGVYAKYGLCRHMFRKFALEGKLPGIKKASW